LNKKSSDFRYAAQFELIKSERPLQSHKIYREIWGKESCFDCMLRIEVSYSKRFGTFNP